MKKSRALVLNIILIFAFSTFLFADGDELPSPPEKSSDNENSSKISVEKDKKTLNGEKGLRDKLKSLLSDSIVDQLFKEGEVRKTLYGEKEMPVSLKPKTKIADKVVEAWSQETPVFMTEGLYLHKKKKANNAKDINLILRSISKLEGIEYYSASRGKMRTLYEKSYAVRELKDEKGKIIYERIEDPLTENNCLALQKDLTFGEYIYKYSYANASDGVGFNCENTEVLKYSIFKILKEYDMNVALAVTDLGDYLLVYVNTRAIFSNLPGLRNKLERSFSNRADAIYNWFIKEYEK